ncbi:MAG: hypothetical protein UZ16_OP3001000852 [Candidatus Hinthialibacteria bacterium OLB16]|nr:MAG: hypothetical protein UZ16_OP3001000852 [Candidatus Hinthialibacteria bacterium OLB16]
MGVFGLPSVLEAADTIPVEITLGGRQAAYELIRLYPDRVMVKDAGNNRIEISRREIEGATSSTVRHLVEEASVLARRFPKSNLKQFSELADSLEQILVRIDEASLLYGWLLPEASSTARLMRQTDQPVKQTQTIFLSVQSEYDNMLTQVQAGTPLDVNWEEFFARLEQRAGGIPFATVKKEFLAKVRKDIQKLKDRIRSSCEDRVAAIQKQMNQVEGLLADGTLTRDQWQASLQQLQQVAAAIPESGLKAKWSQEIQAFQKSVSQQYAQLEEKRELKKLEEAISQAETRISSASPDLSSLEKKLGDLRLQVSQFPESPTQAALSTHLAELREQVASKSNRHGLSRPRCPPKPALEGRWAAGLTAGPDGPVSWGRSSTGQSGLVDSGSRGRIGLHSGACPPVPSHSTACTPNTHGSCAGSNSRCFKPAGNNSAD